MRKLSLVLGVCYLLWSAWQYISFSRLSSLYSEFGLESSSNLNLFPFLIFAAGMGLIIGYFLNFKKGSIYKILVSIGILGIVIYLLYIFLAGAIADRQVDQMLNQINSSQ